MANGELANEMEGRGPGLEKGSGHGSPLLWSERTGLSLGDVEDGSDMDVDFDGFEKGRPEERI